MPENHNERVDEYGGPLDLPDEHDAVAQEDAHEKQFSLTDNLFALIDDGKTYAEAELRFQKSRAGFIGNRIKYAIAFGLGAFGVLHLALIAATVGLVLALNPVIGPWGATAVVTISLVVIGVLMLRALQAKLNDIRGAFEESGDD